MWLINTSTYALEFHLDPPEYAILSHTWGAEEVTFKDMEDLGRAKAKAGWDKIEQTCRLAKVSRLEYAWVDTCCIDKSSSAELSEAINSMFEWYKCATICFVFLADLDMGQPAHGSDEWKQALKASLPKCRWFSRGWTLQELIAPRNIMFFGVNWAWIGEKLNYFVWRLLSAITKIDCDVLADPRKLPAVPVGRRMSWAANRQTTRVEDVAYSLLGIFDVNLPMIYGEGAKSFIRLQEAIAVATDDLSLFAWSEPPSSADMDASSSDQESALFIWPYLDVPRGVLATSPSQFSKCHTLENIDCPVHFDSRSFVLANRNIQFTTYLEADRIRGDYLMPLHCRNEGEDDEINLRLVKTSEGYVRHWTGKIHHLPTEQSLDSTTPCVPLLVTIPKTVTETMGRQSIGSRWRDAFMFSMSGYGTNTNLMVADMVDMRQSGWTRHPILWDPVKRAFFTDGHSLFVGALDLQITLHPRSPRQLMSGGYVRLVTNGCVMVDSPPQIFVGFTTENTRRSQTTLIKPWVYLCGDALWEREACDMGVDIDTSITDRRQHIPHHVFMAKIGQAARKVLSQGESLRRQLFRRQAVKLDNGEIDEVTFHIKASVVSKLVEDQIVHMVEVEVCAERKESLDVASRLQYVHIDSR